MPDDVLLFEQIGGTLLLTLNRPEARNALNPRMVMALTAAVNDASSQRGLRAIVLTGAGEAFCAGADLAVLGSMRGSSPQDNQADSERFKALFLALLASPLPIIAAVNGPALAGGCGLATACDIILAAPEASFGYPEVKVGFVAALVSVLISRQLGERAARAMLLSGRAYSAEEARALGLVALVARRDELVDKALEDARRLSRGAPGALALTKELLAHTSGMPLRAALEAAAAANLLARESADIQEGLDAFFGKRKPGWVRDDADSR